MLSSLFLANHTIIWAASTAFATYLSTLCLSIVAYRLSPMHPLAKYPGPILARVTKLWGAWLAVNGEAHLVYKKLHEQYGDVVRVGRVLLYIIRFQLPIC
jgi:hypothetical protein